MNVADVGNAVQITAQTANEQLSALFVSAAIIIVAGVVGGIAAYLTEDKATFPAGVSSRKLVARYLMLGLVASASMPLFLSLVRSEIMASIITDQHGDRFQSYLVFTGLCLIAAYSARTFITSISQRVLQQVQEAREEAKDAKETALDVADERAAEPFSAAKLAKLKGDAAEFTGDATGRPNVHLSDNEKAVLRALTRMSFRTATGAAQEAGISRMAVGEVLDSLAEKKLVDMTHSPTTKRIRWAITPAGIAALKAG